MILAILILGGLAAFLCAAVVLVRRSERRLSVGPHDPYAPGAPTTDAGDPVSAYLDRMTASLALPAADVAEVRAELADHLRDSIDSLEAEGLDREKAVREALARLGSAEELGRQIRAAHQSTRRLLAGAGGGVFAAGGGFVLGTLGGYGLGIALALACAALAAGLKAAGFSVPNLTGDVHGTIANSVIIGIALLVAAATATRYAVRTSAGLSRRAPRTLSVCWAAAGAIAFGWWALFGLTGLQTWITVAFELAVPVAAVAAAFVRIERPMPHVGRWAVVAVVVIAVVALLPLLMVASSSGGATSVSTDVREYHESDLHLDTVAPEAPAAWLPADAGFGGGYGSESPSSGTWVAADVGSDPSPAAIAAALANWRAIRFEAWHAVLLDADWGPMGVDTHYTAPFAVQPAVLYGTNLAARFHFERMRDAGMWLVVLTAEGPDGHRYRLDGGTGGSSTFNGSAWDWLTAPQ